MSVAENKKYYVSAAPHIKDRATVPSIMGAVLLALAPIAAYALYMFRGAGLLVMSSCVITAMFTESVWRGLGEKNRAKRLYVDFGIMALLLAAGLVASDLSVYTQWAFLAIMALSLLSDFRTRKQKGQHITDGSAAVTGLLLAFCLPPLIPWWVGALGSVIAVGLARELFGGLGYNVFNPALVARAILLMSWPTLVTANWFKNLDLEPAASVAIVASAASGASDVAVSTAATGATEAAAAATAATGATEAAAAATAATGATEAAAAATAATGATEAAAAATAATGATEAAAAATAATGATEAAAAATAATGATELAAATGATDAVTAATDAVTSATPLALAKGKEIADTSSYYGPLLWANTGGCIGEISAALLILGGLFLIARGIIDWRIPAGYLGSVAGMSLVFGVDPIFYLLAGGVMVGAFFMATDYVTSCTSRWGKFIFGVGCGIITMLLRLHGSSAESVTFAILFMNMCAPLIDRLVRPRVFGEVHAS